MQTCIVFENQVGRNLSKHYKYGFHTSEDQMSIASHCLFSFPILIVWISWNSELLVGDKSNVLIIKVFVRVFQHCNS